MKNVRTGKRRTSPSRAHRSRVNPRLPPPMFASPFPRLSRPMKGHRSVGGAGSPLAKSAGTRPVRRVCAIVPQTTVISIAVITGEGREKLLYKGLLCVPRGDYAWEDRTNVRTVGLARRAERVIARRSSWACAASEDARLAGVNSHRSTKGRSDPYSSDVPKHSNNP